MIHPSLALHTLYIASSHYNSNLLSTIISPSAIGAGEKPGAQKSIDLHNWTEMLSHFNEQAVALLNKNNIIIGCWVLYSCQMYLWTMLHIYNCIETYINYLWFKTNNSFKKEIIFLEFQLYFALLHNQPITVVVVVADWIWY